MDTEMEKDSSVVTPEVDTCNPHAFHLNLPPHQFDSDGVPFISKFAQQKARMIVDLAFSIQLHEQMFVEENPDDGDNVIEDDDDSDYDDDEGDIALASSGRVTLNAISKRCSRLHSQLSTLEGLKHSGISQTQLCKMILHLLRLITATVTKENLPGESDSTKSNRRRKAVLHYENVGYICKGTEEPPSPNPPDGETLTAELEYRFALPAPAREVLLLILINILGNKGPLRSVSNAAIYPSDDVTNDRILLILHWRPFLRLLLRTAPYLDEFKMGNPPNVSNSRQSTVLQRTVQLIRDARHFFDQGIRPTGLVPSKKDHTAREIWSMVKLDVLYHSHTHACYRSSIILYLFQPSRCTEEYYLEVLPDWYESWTNIDRCPEYDFLWLAMLCRARKHVSPKSFDWGPIRRRILTHCQYWLQLPIGGASMDKNFPRAANPRSRSCPSRLKEFVGSGSSYEEGIDFVAKVTKLLVICLGTGEARQVDGSSEVISEGTRDALRFLSFVTPYFNPSNLGSWTFTLGAFLHYFSYELCCRVGIAAGMESLKESNLSLVTALCDVQPTLTCAAIPPQEMVALMDALLPLCQQALYSKNGHVGRAGEAAMLYLIQIDPVHAAPSFIDFATRALDIAAVNLSHQAPAALSALTRLIQPALRCNPSILMARLPDILRLCLAGIDRNDQNKTIRTLILYRSISSWMPIGGKPEHWPTLDVSKEEKCFSSQRGATRVGKGLCNHITALHNSSEYLDALAKLPRTSLLKQGIDSDSDYSAETQRLLMEEAAAAMDDWVLEFLDRIFNFLRASGEREKAGKTSSGVASRHSSVDVHQARNFSRVLKECMLQVFASMDESVKVHAIRSVTRFLQEDTLPNAAKDTSFLCQAVAGARCVPVGNGEFEIDSPGLDALIPVLTDDLEHVSTKTAVYRLRCLCGAVKSASHALMKHRAVVSKCLDFALASTDKHLFKTGCKLLRHTLASLCESYPMASEYMPRVVIGASSRTPVVVGRSAQLCEDKIRWHVPNTESIEFAWSLLDSHVVKRLASLCKDGQSGESVEENEKVEAAKSQKAALEIRRCLRVVRYSLRGGSGMLLDTLEDGGSKSTMNNSDPLQSGHTTSLTPHESSVDTLLKTASSETRSALLGLRGQLCSFVVAIASIISSELFDASSPELASSGDAISNREYLALLGSDAKVCRETADIALLLLTRRAANFRSQEARNICKAQKQSATNFTLCALSDHIVESLQRASLYSDTGDVQYKDGEDGGKTIPRRLLVTRVKLFHDSLNRNASFEIPRRLRRLQGLSCVTTETEFDPKASSSDLPRKLAGILSSSPPNSLIGYQGLLDGLYSLCCHSNTRVRATGISVVDYAITRYGWLVRSRVPRLLSAISLQDEDVHGKFGIPSCSILRNHVDVQGKRKRLAEAMKGVCSLLALPRSVKELMSSDEMRLSYVKTVCGTDSLISLFPTEEIQKMVHYLQNIFSKFRSKFYSLPRTSVRELENHEKNLQFLLDVLSENDDKSIESNGEQGDKVGAHWRKLLLVCWFLMAQVDEDDVNAMEGTLASKIWTTCFWILENEKGQPLQRVALGLFGRLISMRSSGADWSLLNDRMLKEEFCQVIGDALVYDHKEDTSFGGGHAAQWATGVEDIVRDASRNVAPRSLFPFQRTSQSSTTFKVTHAQLIQQILVGLGKTDCEVAGRYLLSFARGIAAAPPSEDQRNQQCTSAEIFAGVCRAHLDLFDGDDETIADKWKSVFIPYLDEIIPKIPVSFIGSYFDSLRFALQFSPPNAFYPLSEWLFSRVESNLWQPENRSEKDAVVESDDAQQSSVSTGARSEGFTAQSKWLYLCCGLLIEIDETEIDGTLSRTPWYTSMLTTQGTEPMLAKKAAEHLEKSWTLVIERLLPRLLKAVGHPYESCRDHISGCLFRICHCYRKKMRINASRVVTQSATDASAGELTNPRKDPGSAIVEKLLTLQQSDGWDFTERYNGLISARRFFSYCIHLGEAKHEFSDYIISLLSLAFEALKSTLEEDGNSADVAKRSLEAEVVKGYRYTIAEVSITAVVSYGKLDDTLRVLEIVKEASKHEFWQVRQGSAHFLRCFQGSHKFLFTNEGADTTMSIVTDLLADERREVSSAAMATLTGILAASPMEIVVRMVKKYIVIAKRSTMKRKKKGQKNPVPPENGAVIDEEKEKRRAKNQLTSVFFLCASIMAQPYDTPPYVPEALAAISKHSFERNAPLGVRDTVKKCCAEYKRTHMSDNWELHRSVFTQEQLEALEDVVSTPHYYA